MKIFINNIRIRAHHGVMEQERQVGADFLVSVEVESSNEASTLTDHLGDTVSYADVAELVRQEMAVPSQLLEHVAGRIGRRLMTAHPTLSGARVRITKLAPPITGLECEGAGVEVETRGE